MESEDRRQKTEDPPSRKATARQADDRGQTENWWLPICTLATGVDMEIDAHPRHTTSRAYLFPNHMS